MVGMIVTGHGSFATGLTSGLRLLAGEPEYCEAVDFAPEDSADTLTEKLQAALARLDSCESVLILADLAGGSPFNAAARLKMAGDRKLEVIGGANLPAVLDAYMARMAGPDEETLAEGSLQAGKEAMVRFSEIPGGDGEYEE